MTQLYDKTLLYVEDDAELRGQFTRVLRSRFKQVFEAEDGAIALELYDKYSPDMMLVDINLPKINGLEVIEEIRKSNHTIPIVILSAYSDQEKLLKAIRLGLSDYLIKPVPHKELLALLEEMALVHGDKVNIVALKNDYFWSKDDKSLTYNDEKISLTKRERIFLDCLVKEVGKVVTFDSLAELIWENDVAYSSLSHLLKRLRKKLPKELIENIYGEGYRISSS